MNSTTVITVTSLKNTSYIAAFAASVTYIGIVPETMALFALLMVIDVITGIARSAFNKGCRSINSRTARKGIVAKLMLMLAVFSIGITAKILGYDASGYVQATMVILSLGELYSIIGNIHSMRTGKPKVEFDAVSLLLKKVRTMLDKIDSP